MRWLLINAWLTAVFPNFVTKTWYMFTLFDVISEVRYLNLICVNFQIPREPQDHYVVIQVGIHKPLFTHPWGFWIALEYIE